MSSYNKVNIKKSTNSDEHLGIENKVLTDYDGSPVVYNSTNVTENMRFGLSSTISKTLLTTDIIYPKTIRNSISNGILPSNFLDFYIQTDRTNSNNIQVPFRNEDLHEVEGNGDSQYTRKYTFVGSYLENLDDRILLIEDIVGSSDDSDIELPINYTVNYKDNIIENEQVVLADFKVNVDTLRESYPISEGSTNKSIYFDISLKIVANLSGTSNNGIVYLDVSGYFNINVNTDTSINITTKRLRSSADFNISDIYFNLGTNSINYDESGDLEFNIGLGDEFLADNDNISLIDITLETKNVSEIIFTKSEGELNTYTNENYLFAIDEKPLKYDSTNDTYSANDKRISNGSAGINDNDFIIKSQIDAIGDGKEDAFDKNTAFNKDFGTTSGTVSEGNHTHTEFVSYDSHLLDSTIHFTQSQITITESQISDLQSYELISNKNIASGYAGLDSNTKVPLSLLPDTAKQATYVVLDSTERDALTNLIEGDKAFETSTGDSYIWDSSSWILMADADWENVNIDWINIVGTPNTISGYGITDAYTQSEISTILTDYRLLTNNSFTDNVFIDQNSIKHEGNSTTNIIQTNRTDDSQVAYLQTTGLGTFNFETYINKPIYVNNVAVATVDDLSDGYLPLTGGTLTGDLDMDGNDIIDVNIINPDGETTSFGGDVSITNGIGNVNTVLDASDDGTGATRLEVRANDIFEVSHYLISYGKAHTSQAGEFSMKNAIEDGALTFYTSDSVSRERFRIDATGISSLYSAIFGDTVTASPSTEDEHLITQGQVNTIVDDYRLLADNISSLEISTTVSESISGGSINAQENFIEITQNVNNIYDLLLGNSSAYGHLIGDPLPQPLVGTEAIATWSTVDQSTNTDVWEFNDTLNEILIKKAGFYTWNTQVTLTNSANQDRFLIFSTRDKNNPTEYFYTRSILVPRDGTTSQSSIQFEITNDDTTIEIIAHGETSTGNPSTDLALTSWNTSLSLDFLLLPEFDFNHALMLNLDYDNSGHTGFASEIMLGNYLQTTGGTLSGDLEVTNNSSPTITLRDTLADGDSNVTFYEQNTSSGINLKYDNTLNNLSINAVIDSVSTNIVEFGRNTKETTFNGDVDVNGNDLLDVEYINPDGEMLNIGGTLNVESDLRLTVPNDTRFANLFDENYIYEPSNISITNTPDSLMTWHDILAFSTVDLPYVELSDDDITWTETTSTNWTHKPFAHKSDKMNVTSTGGYVRWTWDANAFRFCGAKYLVINFPYSSALETYINFETSDDALTWNNISSTSIIGSDYGLKIIPLPIIGNEGYWRLTLNDPSRIINISTIQMLSYRISDSGDGHDLSFPYKWDEIKQVFFENNVEIDGSLTLRDDENLNGVDYNNLIIFRDMVDATTGYIGFPDNGNTDMYFYNAIGDIKFISDLDMNGHDIIDVDNINPDGELTTFGGDIEAVKATITTSSFGGFHIDRDGTSSSAIKHSNDNGVLGYSGVANGEVFTLWDNDIETKFRVFLVSGLVQIYGDVDYQGGTLINTGRINPDGETTEFGGNLNIRDKSIITFGDTTTNVIESSRSDDTFKAYLQYTGTGSFNFEVLDANTPKRIYVNDVGVATVDDLVDYLPLTGGTLTSDLDLNGNNIIDVDTINPDGGTTTFGGDITIDGDLYMGIGDNIETRGSIENTTTSTQTCRIGFDQADEIGIFAKDVHINTYGGSLRFSNIPTSSTGLSDGDVWNDGGLLKIV